VDEGFKKSILDDLIDLRGITKIVIRDPGDSILVDGYDVFETAACFLMFS
jgi:hypothetical protein